LAVEESPDMMILYVMQTEPLLVCWSFVKSGFIN
jgi:hypothetical protein